MAVRTAEATASLGLAEQGDEVGVISTPKFKTGDATQSDQELAGRSVLLVLLGVLLGVRKLGASIVVKGPWLDGEPLVGDSDSTSEPGWRQALLLRTVSL